jgi:hypothetical protein
VHDLEKSDVSVRIDWGRSATRQGLSLPYRNRTLAVQPEPPLRKGTLTASRRPQRLPERYCSPIGLNCPAIGTTDL